jgi:hypothetical protein
MPSSNAYGADQQFGRDQAVRAEPDDKKLAKGDDKPIQTEERDRELSDDKKIREECLKLYKDLEKGFSDQWERANSTMDYWDIYNCILGSKQFYSGNSKIFLPLCHDAVNARKTRFVNQMFPQSGKHIEVTASEDKPMSLMSLLEFYIRKTKLRTNIMPALVRNGDVEGHYNLYLRWIRNKRHVAQRVTKKRTIDDMQVEGDDYEDIEEQVITHQYPGVEVIPDSDVLVLPFVCDSVEGAINSGGSVTIIRRWSKAKIRQLIDEEELDEDAGESLIEAMSSKSSTDTPNKKKNMVDAAGIKTEGGKTTALIYETWTKLEVDDEMRICRIYLGGEDRVLSCKLNPYWCDKVPLLSAPVEKIEGSFKGISKLKFVETIQYMANDAINEGMDSAAYALLPIIMTDPEKNPRVGSMVLNVAAIWETNPKDTQFAQFPQLWKEAFQIVGAAKEQIQQTLGVNPAMIPQQSGSGGKKPNQAQIANEQQVDILTTADAVTSLEGEILTPMLQWFIWLDHQFRDADVMVPSFGELGIQIEMEKIPPVQMDRRFEFRWFGVEAARNQQQLQMQMAAINVLKQVPPQSYPGYEIQLAPVISHWVENVFGPRMAPQIFTDVRKKLTLDPHFENTILQASMPLAVHPMDNDTEHMQVHMQAMQEEGDLSGFLREHMVFHQMQMQKKQAAMAMQQQQMMQPRGGGPGGGGGGPRQGAAPAGPRPNGQGPPGLIHQDRIPQGMPRRAG